MRKKELVEEARRWEYEAARYKEHWYEYLEKDRIRGWERAQLEAALEAVFKLLPKDTQVEFITVDADDVDTTKKRWEVREAHEHREGRVVKVLQVARTLKVKE